MLSETVSLLNRPKMVLVGIGISVVVLLHEATPGAPMAPSKSSA